MKEILTPLQKEIIKIFSLIDGAKNFYLTGGTALAVFYLHHRLSEDIDIFTSEEEIILYTIDEFVWKLKENNFEADVLRKFKTFGEIIIKKENETNKVHIAYDSPFRLNNLQETEFGIKVDSFIDIATNKLLTIFGRADLKDFIDVFFIVKEKNISLQELIEKARNKDPGLDTYFLAIAFEEVRKFPEEIDKLPITMLKPLDLTELKRMFINEAIQLVDKGLQK